jgi:hypothetical protein
MPEYDDVITIHTEMRALFLFFFLLPPQPRDVFCLLLPTGNCKGTLFWGRSVNASRDPENDLNCERIHIAATSHACDLWFVHPKQY